jgi:hypothetical protein
MSGMNIAFAIVLAAVIIGGCMLEINDHSPGPMVLVGLVVAFAWAIWASAI